MYLEMLRNNVYLINICNMYDFKDILEFKQWKFRDIKNIPKA